MKINKNYRKKFSKKYDFLQKSLLNFVDWRNQQNLTSPVSSLLQRERILLENSYDSKNGQNRIVQNYSNPKYSPFGLNSKTPQKNEESGTNQFQHWISEQNAPLNTNAFFEKQFSFLRFPVLTNAFFPFKKPFMHYWIFPLLGLVFFTSKKDPFFPHLNPSMMDSQFRSNKSPIHPENVFNTEDIIWKSPNEKPICISYENQSMKQAYSQLLEMEQNELQHLCNDLFGKLDDISFESYYNPTNLNVSETNDQKTKKFNEVFNQKLFWPYNSFYWNWYSLNMNDAKNHNIKAIFPQKALFLELEKFQNGLSADHSFHKQKINYDLLPSSSFYNASLLLDSYMKRNNAEGLENRFMYTNQSSSPNVLPNVLHKLKMSEKNLVSKIQKSKLLSSFIKLLNNQKWTNQYKMRENFEKQKFNQNISNRNDSFLNLIHLLSLDFDKILINKFLNKKSLDSSDFLTNHLQSHLEDRDHLFRSLLKQQHVSSIYNQLLLQQLKNKQSLFTNGEKWKPQSLQKKTINTKLLAYELMFLRSYKQNIQGSKHDPFYSWKSPNSLLFQTHPFQSSLSTFHVPNPSVVDQTDFNQNSGLTVQTWKQIQDFYTKKKNFQKWQEVFDQCKDFNLMKSSASHKETHFIVKLQYPILLWKPINLNPEFKEQLNTTSLSHFIPLQLKEFRYRLYQSIKSSFDLFPSLDVNYFESNTNKNVQTSESFQLAKWTNSHSLNSISFRWISPKQNSLVSEDLSNEHTFWNQIQSNWFDKNEHSLSVGKTFSNFLNHLSAQTSVAFEDLTLQLLDKKLANASKLYLSPMNSNNSINELFYNSNPLDRKVRIFKRKKLLNKVQWTRKKENRRFEKVFRTYFSAKADKSINGKDSSVEQSNLFYMKKMSNHLDSNESLLKNIHDINKMGNVNHSIHNTSLSKLKNRLKYKQNKHLPFYLNTYFIEQNQTSRHFQTISSLEKRIENLYSFQKIRISNTSLLKRLGFIFLQKDSVSSPKTHHKLNSVTSPNLNKNYENQYLFKDEELLIQSRLQKEKYLQKKRRRKKQKLETRRRKKRKRFFPRPTWLRFHLYKKFLTYRHPLKESNVPQIDHLDPYLHQKSLLKLTIDDSLVFKSTDKKVVHSNTASLNFIKSPRKVLSYKKGDFEQKIYRNQKQKWGRLNQDTPFFEKVILQKKPFYLLYPISQNNEQYKISNSILSEFQRLCWKSYWLQSNLTPYIRRIENNFQQIKKVEKETVSMDFLKNWTSNLLGFHLLELIHPISSTLQGSYPDDSQIDNVDRQLYVKSNHFNDKKNSEVLCYLNIRNAMDHNNFVSSFSNFQSLENVPEYNRILYERICEVIKNVKFNLNADGQASMKSYKVGRRRKENNVISSSSFMKKVNHFIYDMFGQHPRFSKLSLFSTDPSIQPYGELTTLRTLWALSHTNLFQLKENNQMKLLWGSLKQREQAKSNQTKKFISKSLRQFYSLKWNPLYTNTTSGMNQSSDLNIPKISNPYLDYSSAQKLKKIQDKSMTLGTGTHTNNYNQYLRTLKLELKSKSVFHYQNKKSYRMKYIQATSTTSTKPQATVKSAFNYWWSTGQFNLKSIFFSTNYAHPLETIYQNDSMKTSFKHFLYDSYHSEFLDFEQSRNVLSSNSLILNFKQQFFQLCVVVFHLCICLSLFKIPEIRSVLKFNVLLIYKLVNSYFIVLYFIYDLLRNYQTQFSKMVVLVSKNFKKETMASNLLGSVFESVYPLDQPKAYFNSYSFPKKTIDSMNHIQTQKEKLFRFPQKGHNVLYQASFLEWTIRFPENHNLFFSSRTNHSDTDVQRLSGSSQEIYSLSRRLSTNLSSLWFHMSQFPLDFQSKTLKNQFNSTFLHSTSNKIQKTGHLSISVSLTWLQAILSLGILYSAKTVVSFGYGSLNISYSFLLKILDMLESFMFIIYKFLEKPAELMVEWIAQMFLIEWSSDVTTFLPETFDTYFWNSVLKFSRTFRVLEGNLILNSVSFGSLLSNSYAFQPSMTGFVSSNALGFLLQRRLWSLMEICSDSVFKPDMDLMVRQKKGMIFWDIWAEILIQAAEKYNLNIPSLVSLKEEQELLIERLLQDSTFLNHKTTLFKSDQTQNFMIPLMKLIQTERPTNWKTAYDLDLNQLTMLNISKWMNRPQKTTNFSNFILKQTLESSALPFQDQLSNLNSQNSVSWENIETNIWKRWSSNQYLTYQSRETDLFLDFHPPKSLVHLNYFKQYESAQNTIGSLICQIYSGLFSKQVSKNILIVGPQGSSKSLLIQALAGETEMKILTDNANRYALVQRGVAVGMKLLRDVFDAIALQTPCIFLMEDIHVIGEKRPMLISDEENSKVHSSSFGMEQQEVHEGNQIMYQLSRHAINDYKRPYKGDFSSLIPTNVFTEELFSTRNIFRKNPATLSSKSHPLPIQSIEQKTENQGQSETQQFLNPFDSHSIKNQSLVSRLQLSLDNIFAPPATSPFTILMMKEQKKFKSKKLVKEIPWGGFSTDQMLLISKNNYSVRTKVALLADLAMSQFSIKLDMITDLLVIIDSVRSNRGFVVFATTHVPSVLDPALRRPGRLDEMIYLPTLPNFMTRFNFLKLNLLNFSSTLDFIDYSLMTSHFSESHLNHLVSKTKLLLFNTKSPTNQFSYSIYSPIQSLNYFLQEPLLENIQSKNSYSDLQSIYSTSQKTDKSLLKPFKGSLLARLRNPKYFLTQSSRFDHTPSLSHADDVEDIHPAAIAKYNMLPSGPSQVLGFAYSEIGHFLIRSYFLKDPTSFGTITWTPSNFSKSEPFLFTALYGSNQEFKSQITQYFAGKVAEFLVGNSMQKGTGTYDKSPNEDKETRSNIYSQGFWNIATSSQWQSATALVFSILQKRYLYHPNLLVSKMLSFDNLSSLREPPSPPGSTILGPAKNYENFKRTERDFQQKRNFSINEKIQKHQQQRFMKQLYNQPVQQMFRSEMVSRRQTVFSSSSKELGYLDSFMQKPTSIGSFYQNRLLTRQRYSLINQWWNSQLAEHNAETTYLSDVDWRTMFVSSSSQPKSTELSKESSHKTLSGEFLLDFPDSDQHYNPRQRRWFLHSQSWNYWLSFEQRIQYEIYYHFIMESFNSALEYLDMRREVLDAFVFVFLQKGYLKEIDFISFSSRYYVKDF